MAGIHLVCWLLFLVLPGFFRPGVEHYSLTSLAEDIMIPPRLANGLFFIVLFYFSYYVAIPGLYIRRRYAMLVGYFMLTFIIFALINYLMMPPFMKDEPTSAFKLLGPSHNLFMYIITCLFSFSLCMYVKWRNLQQEKLNTEISFLKAQINPHFLFNALNSIYSLSIIKSDDTPEAVLKLSGIMRYAVSDASQQYVSLDKELAYIKDYISLQRLRLTPEVVVNVSIQGDTKGKTIAPFLLIPFIENAFKYGINAEEHSALDIGIYVSGSTLQMKVHNLKVTPPAENMVTPGLGITNTRHRLHALYPGKHEFSIDETDADFQVFLKLELE